ncbi:MAG TPA: aminoglycoside 6-adenylyltransferase [Ktedonobacterales bacterium]|nr:aminoglycoside 6-adenylyltransferase [Ktedonobacterales bacterium]
MPDTPDTPDTAPASEDEVLARIVAWAEEQPLVRAVVLESSRTVAGAPLDRFSDYDILLVVAETRPFSEDNDWQRFFGEPLTRFGDAKETLGFTTYFRLVFYQDHTKIDFAIWPVELLREVVERQESTDLLDWGYRVLLDKDGLAARLPAPTRTAHIPRKPSEREYLALVEEFWWEATYVAKNLWRDELVMARYNLDVVMRSELLLPMLEWRVELDRDWSWKPGMGGRGLKRALPPDLWAAFERTYAGPGIPENWDATFAMTALFRRVAREVGDALSYAYPQAMDDGVSAYLEATWQLSAD